MGDSMNGGDESSITGDWSEWRRHVLLEIRRLNGNMERVNDQHLDVLNDLSRLKVQSAIWGALGGILVSLLLTKLIMGV